MKKIIKKGFTLVEIMIVVAVLGLLFLAMQSFSAEANIAQSRADKLAEKIHDVIRDAKHDMTTGKKISPNETAQYREVKITSGDNWGVTRGAFLRTNTSSNSPQDPSNSPQDPSNSPQDPSISEMNSDKNYRLSLKVFWKKNEDLVWREVNSITLKFDDDLTNSAISSLNDTTDNNFDKYQITVDYKGFKRYIIGDAVTGNVEVQNKSADPNDSQGNALQTVP